MQKVYNLITQLSSKLRFCSKISAGLTQYFLTTEKVWAAKESAARRANFSNEKFGLK